MEPEGTLPCPQSVVSILCLINPVHTLEFNIMLQPMYRSPELSTSGFQTEILYAYHISPFVLHISPISSSLILSPQ
jgi:hypothetical protein